MKHILLFFLTLAALLLHQGRSSGQAVTEKSFNTNQFTITDHRITVKDGALLTNVTVRGSASLPASTTVGGNQVSTNVLAINPTDNYLPYRSNATTFGDSPWYRISTNDLGFNGTGRFLFSDSNIGNLGIGNATLDALTSGTLNTSFGYFSMSSLQAGIQNTAFGYYSMRDAVGATYNTAFGLQSLRDNIGGTFNTAVGWNSLRGTTGDNNTAIGASAGITNSTGVGNVFVGYNANPSTAATTNEIVIGADVVGNGANTTVIGNTNTTSAHIIASGYAGGGTKFLSDDGTYKTVGGGTLWTNISGVVTMVPGQTATNRLSFTSGAADNNTNAVMQIDTSTLWQFDESFLLRGRNFGTNVAGIQPNGSFWSGRFAFDPNSPVTFPDPNSSFVSYRSVALGDQSNNELHLGVFDSDGFNYLSTLDVYTSIDNTTFPTAELKLESDGDSSPASHIRLIATTGSERFLMRAAAVDLVSFRPTIASSGSAVAYTFDTSNTLTNGDKFATFGNAGVPLITLAPAAAGNPAGQIIFGPGTTNVLYRSVSDLEYTNATTGAMYFTLRKETAGKVARFGMGSGGNATILAGTGLGVLLAPDNSSQTMFAVASGFYPSATSLTLGTTTAGNQWGALYLGGSAPSVVWNGTTNTVYDGTTDTSPEGVDSASPGSIKRSYTNGNAYVKKAGATSSGWETLHSGNMAYLAADATSVDTSMANLSISATVRNGKKYSFKLVIFLANSTPTDGAKFDFDGGSATATNFRVHGTAFGSALSGSAQSTTLATDHTVSTVTGDNMMEFNGSFEPSADGTFIPRFAESVDAGGTLTVYRGSNLILTEIP